MWSRMQDVVKWQYRKWMCGGDVEEYGRLTCSETFIHKKSGSKLSLVLQHRKKKVLRNQVHWAVSTDEIKGRGGVGMEEEVSTDEH